MLLRHRLCFLLVTFATLSTMALGKSEKDQVHQKEPTSDFSQLEEYVLGLQNGGHEVDVFVKISGGDDPYFTRLYSAFAGGNKIRSTSQTPEDRENYQSNFKDFISKIKILKNQEVSLNYKKIAEYCMDYLTYSSQTGHTLSELCAKALEEQDSKEANKTIKAKLFQITHPSGGGSLQPLTRDIYVVSHEGIKLESSGEAPPSSDSALSNPTPIKSQPNGMDSRVQAAAKAGCQGYVQGSDGKHYAVGQGKVLN
jgi:hypothetical protein